MISFGSTTSSKIREDLVATLIELGETSQLTNMFPVGSDTAQLKIGKGLPYFSAMINKIIERYGNL